MCSKVKILDPADSQHLAGQIVELSEVLRQNAERKSKNQPLIKYENIIMGISRVALRTRSFLAAASFMETTSVLIDAAISGKIDKLEGLKENIIIGKLIPAGTGIRADFIDTK
jgi:DNA-directed RNA polymerase subunit beta'